MLTSADTFHGVTFALACVDCHVWAPRPDGIHSTNLSKSELAKLFKKGKKKRKGNKTKSYISISSYTREQATVS